MVDANPGMTKFVLDDRFQMVVQLDKCYVIDNRASSTLADFMETGEILVNCVTTNLELSKFTRLGFRLTYIKDFADKTSAAEFLIGTKMMAIPEGKHFNIEGKVLMPRYSLVWEGESTGIRSILEVQSQKIDLEPQIEVIDEIPPFHVEKHRFIYDVDYYTLQPTSRGQLNVKEWISQAYHLIKRDSKVFFGG